MLIHEGFYHWAKRLPSKQALQDPDRNLTYSELAGCTNSLAHAMVELGLRPGERIALLMENSVELVVSHLAALAANAVVVPVDPKLTQANTQFVLNDCEPTGVVIQASLLDSLAQILTGTSSLKWILVAPSTSHTRIGSLKVHSWEATLGSGSDQPPRARRTAQETALLMYTSGTTGRAKGTMLTHANLLAASSNIIQFANITQQDTELLTLPLTHLFGLAHINCYLRMGGRVILRKSLKQTDEIFQTISSEGVTSFPAVPTSFAMLLARYRPLLTEHARKVRYMFTNSAVMPVEHILEIRRLLPETRLLMYYGLTEASRSTFVDYAHASQEQLRSVGPAAPGITLGIYKENGQLCSTAETGEVVVKGPTVTPGYWKRPEETAQVLKPEGLHTGDLGHLDPEGHLFITGRLKEIINTGGMKLSPLEVEQILKKHPAVEEVGVAGIPDPSGMLGEVVKAYVVFKPKQQVEEAVLQKFAMERLEPYKVPRTIQAVDKLPKTDSGKLQRARLRELDPPGSKQAPA